MNNRENTLKTKEIADKLIPLMEACGCDICKQLLGSAGAAVRVIIPEGSRGQEHLYRAALNENFPLRSGERKLA